ncbi:patatin-like phospholipase family protein [Nocardia bovistercoris]|uniref:PNPLA domain-containing protein n=1 Tax=Nocardia bovistercoris TaxID=2785916 RepID=A0A931N4X9_9NOCA|nr:patatin-like phospholipase family protein [Nocardia bovistercoris]MBH0779299.1 hypothetical protein [Nocardia bovistercoris]
MKPHRAVVLGPGGVPGTAWLLGLLTGLRRGGIDLAEADTVVGTSAGAIAGMLLGGDTDLARPAPNPELESGPNRGDPNAMAQAHLLLGGSAPTTDTRRQVGRIASTATATPAHIWVARMRHLIGDVDWPANLLVPAVDADSGEPIVWRAGDGVPPASAVAAGTAAPGMAEPIPVGDRRYFDGAFRAGLNTDLVPPKARVIIAEPLGLRMGNAPVDTHPDVVRITADAAADSAFGPDLSDRSRWQAAFEAGLRQSIEATPLIRRIWTLTTPVDADLVR